MPLVPADSIVAKVGRLTREVTYHKRELNRHRERLREKKHELAALIADCSARGITIDPVNTHRGEGTLHGPDRTHS